MPPQHSSDNHQMTYCPRRHPPKKSHQWQAFGGHMHSQKNHFMAFLCILLGLQIVLIASRMGDHMALVQLVSFLRAIWRNPPQTQCALSSFQSDVWLEFQDRTKYEHM